MENQLTYISEVEVKKLLSWPLVFDAVREALRSVCKIKITDNQPTSSQPPRPKIVMQRRSGMVFSMLGYIDNYKLPSIDAHKIFDTLGHKLVTCFENNEKLDTPLPNILGTIFLIDTVTGKLQTIIEANEITAWRTAAASLVSTKYLYFNRVENQLADKILAIIGCSVQGRIHAIGMCSMFPIGEIHLWNRTKSKAVSLSDELNGMKSSFLNPNVKVFVHETVNSCVQTADIIVTATYADSPLLFASMLKSVAHINAIGAGSTHHSEIDRSVYEKSMIFVDSFTSAESELKTLSYPIEGEVGEVINGAKGTPQHSLTIFQSLGMAVEDAIVGQLILELYNKKKKL